MKTRTKIILPIIIIPVCCILGFVAWGIYWNIHYVHLHCIKGTGLAFRIYSGDHNGKLPFSTNGFGNALLLLAGADSTNDYTGGSIGCLCGPGDDGHLYREALKRHSVLPEEKCSRVYIQGLSETNNPQICVLFDRDSCRGGDHFRSPWGHPVREVCMLDGSMEVISDEHWPEFSRQQVELLVAAGFSRTNALRFYPAANNYFPASSRRRQCPKSTTGSPGFGRYCRTSW